MFAELYGKATGCCGGQGRLDAPGLAGDGMLGASAIVAGTVPMAVGAALASTLRSTDDVSVAFFGDAAVEQGVMHESLAFRGAALLAGGVRSENNLYATLTPLSQRQVSADIWPRAGAHGLAAVGVDGNDVVAVYERPRWRWAAPGAARARPSSRPRPTGGASTWDPTSTSTWAVRTQGSWTAGWRANPIAALARTLEPGAS